LIFLSNSVEEALQVALAELLAKEWVKAAEIDETFSEDKPCNYVRKRFNVLHKTSQGGYIYSAKEIYINKSDFTYVWHYGGGELEEMATPFKDLVETSIPWLNATIGSSYIEIITLSETDKVATCLAYKGTTEHYADTYTLKIWWVSEGIFDFKIVEHKVFA
jgi:hypothetical protein